jgi:hypothetical protein
MKWSKKLTYENSLMLLLIAYINSSKRSHQPLAWGCRHASPEPLTPWGEKAALIGAHSLPHSLPTRR